MTPYEFLSHTADIRVVITAENWGELLQSSTALLRSLIVGNSPAHSNEFRTIRLQHEETDELLFHFLREVLYLYESERLVPVELEIVDVSPHYIHVTLHVERFDSARHDAEPEVKAVTRHGFTVTRSVGGWRAEVVFDV